MHLIKKRHLKFPALKFETSSGDSTLKAKGSLASDVGILAVYLFLFGEPTTGQIPIGSLKS